MTRILLDTSAYSAAKKDHPEAVRILEEADEILMSPVVVGELLSGFRKGNQFEKNCGDLQTFLLSPGVSAVSVDQETAARYALIFDFLRRAGTPVSPNDLWIAASAMQFGAQLVTADRDYQKIPQIFTILL